MLSEIQVAGVRRWGRQRLPLGLCPRLMPSPLSCSAATLTVFSFMATYLQPPLRAEAAAGAAGGGGAAATAAGTQS